MKKYKVVKWLVLGMAAFAVICFCLPFLYDGRELVSAPGGGPREHSPEMLYGFNFFMIGDIWWDIAAFSTIIAFAIAIVAVVLSFIPIVSKDANGLNKRGKIHRTLIWSISLSVLSALTNLISITNIEVAYGGGPHESYTSYTYIYFIPIVIAAIVAIVLLVRLKRDIVSIDFCGYLEGDMVSSGKRSICISNGACFAWAAGQSDIVLSKETVKSVEYANKTVSDMVDGKRENFDVYNITMTDGQAGTLSLLHSCANSVVRAASGLTAVSVGAPMSESSASSRSRGGKSKGAQESAFAGDPYDPKGKPLDWFGSEAGLQTYNDYITPQNYSLEETYKKNLKERHNSTDYDVLEEVFTEAKLPRTFFKALIKNINADALRSSGLREMLIAALEDQAKPYIINDDGEPELRKMAFSPEQIVSVDKNPLLYFVKNFDVFKIEDDAMGTADDKYLTYAKALMFVSAVSDEIVVDDNKWLLDKATYLNDFGIVRKEKGFIKKCMECTDNVGFLAIFGAMLSGVDLGKERRAQIAAVHRQEQERAQQAYEQSKQAEEQRRFAEQQLEAQKQLADQQKCFATHCPSCKKHGTPRCGYSANGSGGCKNWSCF